MSVLLDFLYCVVLIRTELNLCFAFKLKSDHYLTLAVIRLFKLPCKHHNVIKCALSDISSILIIRNQIITPRLQPNTMCIYTS